MKWFVRDILTDAAKLTALIIVPMAFLGPGWRPKDSGFARQQSTQDGLLSESTSGETTEQGGDRYIEILRAFDPPGGGYRDERQSSEEGER